MVRAPPWHGVTAEWTYLRYQGPNASVHPYQGSYGEDRLTPVADRLSEWLAQGVGVYAYFNNDDSGFAVQNARRLAPRLGGTAA
jgi:uncharacterized protein YecE (DUF72 family)